MTRIRKPRRTDLTWVWRTPSYAYRPCSHLYASHVPMEQKQRSRCGFASHRATRDIKPADPPCALCMRHEADMMDAAR